MVRNLVDRKMAELNQKKASSVSQMKLEHFTRSIKEDCLDENDDKSASNTEDIRKSQGFSFKNQEKVKESIENFHKSSYILKFLSNYDFSLCFFF